MLSFPTTFSATGVGMAALLAALLTIATQPALAQNRMNAKGVAVTSNAPVTQVEAVNFSGAAVISSRLAGDPDFGKPTLVMLIDMTGVSGVGAQSGTKYVLSSQEHIVRPHAGNQNIEFTFPMATDENAPIARVRTGSARFVMNVDLGTGMLTSIAAVLTAR